MSDGFTREDLDIDFGYTRIPHGLWQHPDMTHFEKVLLGWLWSHETPFLARLSTREIRRQFNGSSTVVTALQHLLELGFMERSSTGRNRTVYRLLKAPWQALFGTRLAANDAPSTGPKTGPLTSSDWSGNRTGSGPEIGPDLVRKSDRIEDHLEDHQDDDDSTFEHNATSPAEHESSSSDEHSIAQVARLAANILLHRKGDDVRDRTGWVRQTARAIRRDDERGPEIRALLARGLTPIEAAAELVDSDMTTARWVSDQLDQHGRLPARKAAF